MTHPRGSEWSIWDLHVHTPASIVQHYGGSTDEVWNKFIQELEALPPEIQVLGINDYWFLDGYKRVREAHAHGRIANIRAVFAVIEMRLNIFGGSDNALKRQNLHVIFDPNLDSDVIQAQFLNAIAAKFQLLPDRKAPWAGTITPQALEDLGRAVTDAAPEDKKGDYGPPLQEGFNSLVIERSALHEALNKHFFKGKYLLALGKAEWSAVKWEQSAAAKRDIIGDVDLLFTAFQSFDKWGPAVRKMKEENLLHKIFDCSDAHYWSDSTQSERIGNCRNWINAEPTFSGLKHAVSEFDHRVYVGLQPPHVERINRNPDLYIASISVRPVAEHAAPVFDYSLDLNSQFVAVVGNKGQGKSALLDCLGLGGGSIRNSEFAFLNEQRFLSSRNKDAGNYAATLTWRDGTSRTLKLPAASDAPSGQVRVEYLPQAFVERVCTAEPNSSEAQEFERELRKVLFSHIPDEDRAGAQDFDSLLNKRTAELVVNIEESRQELGRVIAEYLSLVKFAKKHSPSSLKNRVTEQRAAVLGAERSLESAKKELSDLDARSGPSGVIAELRQHTEELERKRDAALAAKSKIESELALASSSELEQRTITARFEAIQNDVATLNEDVINLVYAPLGLTSSGERLVELVSRENWRHLAEEARRRRRESLVASRRVTDATIEDLQRQLTQAQTDLERQDAVREAARQHVRTVEARLAALRGAVSDEDTLEWLLDIQKRRELLPDDLKACRDRMFTLSATIHSAYLDQARQVTEMFAPVTRYVSEHDSLQATDLEVNVALEVGPEIRAIQEAVDRRRSLPVLKILDHFPSSTPSDWGALKEEIEEILTYEIGSPENPSDPGDDFKMGFSARDFLNQLLGLAWVRLRFGLTSGGVGLATMSPGQRGLILLLFYLLIDKGRAPLLLDQPEENLDNETVAAVVVPALREASKRRQVIIVTHNANLAIVGDADQVVRCTYKDGQFAFESGPISALRIASHAVTVLEGTKRALSNRWSKFSDVEE